MQTLVVHFQRQLSVDAIHDLESIEEYERTASQLLSDLCPSQFYLSSV